MKTWRGNLRSSVLMLALAFFAITAFPLCAHADKKDVLVLHSYHKGYKWTDDENRGIESILKSEAWQQNVNLQIEYLDAKRVSGDAYLQQISDVFKQRFSNRKFSLLMATDDDAFNFLIKYRDKLFGPNTPIVFCGVNNLNDSDPRLTSYRYITGVNEESDFKGDIDLIMKVHPDVKKIVIICDTTTTGQRIKSVINDFAPNYKDLVKFEFLDDMDLPQSAERVKSLPAASVVLYTIYSRDKSGKFYEFDESSSMITKASDVPVYGAWDFSLGTGIVGGLLTSGFAQGQAAGEIAARILNGENVESIPVQMKSPNKFMFDWKQVDHWNIKIAQLPSDSIFINKPKYSIIHISLISAGLVLLGILIFIYKKVL
jgi:ABC-type uncharacterized transport system substrate-binding protein